LSPDTEPKGVGANKWNFYACNDLSGDWTELPIITPTQLKVSRKIKHIFSGDLNRAVLTNPLFLGKESHLVLVILYS
jgi:radial spoke head protein 4A